MRNYNTKLTDDARRLFKLKMMDMLSPEVQEIIQPTVEILPDLDYHQNSTAATSGTISLGVPASGDTYVVYLFASFSKNAACDSATGRYSVQLTNKGVTTVPIQFPVITLTAERDSAVAVFNPPLKVDRGTNINLTGTFTAGVCTRGLSAVGFTVPDA